MASRFFLPTRSLKVAFLPKEGIYFEIPIIGSYVAFLLATVTNKVSQMVLMSKVVKGEEGEVRDLCASPLRTTQLGYCPPSTPWRAKKAWGWYLWARGEKMSLLIFGPTN
jgi:hypothetical protein